MLVNSRPEKKTPGLIFGSLGGTSEGGSYFLGGLIFGSYIWVTLGGGPWGCLLSPGDPHWKRPDVQVHKNRIFPNHPQKLGINFEVAGNRKYAFA